MALNLGELFGTIGLDASEWDKKLVGAQDSLKHFGVAGAALAGAAAVAIGAALTKGVVDAIDIEAGNDKIQASLGLTEEQAGVAGQAAGSLFAANYGDSMEDVNTAVEAVMSSVRGMRDASADEVQAMTADMMNLSKVMGVDVARAAQVAGQMITSGIAKDGTHAADLLAASMQKVPVNVREDILDAIDEYGPFFNNIGIQGEEAMGILVQASEKGMYGIDKTGDALKEFGIRATDMSTASGAAYEALGLDQEEMSAKLLAGGESAKTAFGDIIHGLQEMQDPVAQSQAALALFGTPLEDLSVTEIPNFLGALDPLGDKFDSVAGSAAKLSEDLNSNARAGFDGFKRQAEAALITFVQANIMPSVGKFATFLNTTVGPAITQFGGWITSDALPALQAFSEWFSANLPTIQAWATGVGILLLPLFLKIAISAGASAAAQVVAWTMAAGGAIKAAATYVASSYVMVGAWVKMGAQALIQAARMAAAWFIALGPVGWVIAAIVGIGALIFANWDAIVKFTSEAWGNVSRIVTEWGSNTLGMFRDFAANTGGMFADFFSNTVGMFVDFFTNTVGMVSDFMGMLAAPVSAGLQIVQTIFSTAWEMIQTYVATALAIVIAIFTGQFDKIPAYLSSAWSKITGFFLSGVAAIDSILGGGITTTVNFVIGLWNGLVAWVAGIPQRFMDGLAALGNLAGQVGAWISNAKDMAIRIFMDWVSFVASVPGRIMAGLIALAQLAGTVGAWITSVKDAAVGKFLELVNWVRNVPNMVLDGLRALGNLAGQVGGWVSGMRDAAVSRFLDLVSWVRGLPGMVLGALGNLGGLLVNAGQQIISGFLSGLQAGFESVKNFVGGIGQWIADHKGPKAYDLALLVPAGGWIMDGLETGIRRSMPSLKSTLGDVSATIAGGVTGGHVGLTAGTHLGGSSAVAVPGRSVTYAPHIYGGPDPDEQERKARVRFKDLLTAIK
ncbi:phage-related minor tail protein [Arthrobacter sp. SORGH_AS 212]|uniref:phage tail tape measure protein n=1 Tax=Pseudarthrobacter sp. SORGH_AS 212 TaxID=3041777 RepID=UPI0027849788|nr:phage-related minor tail protein [Arthrobacter sp. SORGH_AS_0212]